MKIETSCEHCVFSTKENEVQVGCLVGRLGAYQKLGVAKLAPEGHYLIEGRRCNLAVRDDAEGVGDINVNDLAVKIKKELRSRASWVICATQDTTKEDVVTSVINAKKQTAPPLEVIIVLVGDKPTRHQMVSACVDLEIPWHVRKIVGKTDEGERYDVWMALRETLKNIKHACQYVVLLEPGKTLPDNFLETLDKRVNEDMDTILLAQPDSGYHGMVVSVAALGAVDGSLQEELRGAAIGVVPTWA